MAPSTLTAQAPTAPHTLVNEPINPLVSSTVAPQTEETQAATEVTCESAETPKDQKSVPLWARIYPVSQPPFEQVLKGHPGDIEPPHASDEFPESQASTEEVQRRKQEIDELENFNVKVGATDSENNVGYEHAWALPWNDQRFKSQWYKQQHLLPHKHSDPALRALNHTDREAFLHKPDVETEKLSPRFGSIIRGQGFDLTKLTSDELDELALFVTQRGVVQIDNQNAFINSGPDKLEEFARHFSQVLHEHPVAGRVQNHPKLLPIYRSDTSLNHLRAYKGSHGIQGVHTDITFESQPPGITALLLLDPGESGGDTLFFDSEELYRRLSPFLRKALTGLEAEHDFFNNPNVRALFNDRPVKRLPVRHIHPVIRTHPVTGRQSVFVNESFVTRLVGLKEEESRALLGLLSDLAAKAHDAQVRVRWHKGTVTLWDNRRTQHKIINDVYGRRHGIRLTPQAERPFYAPTDYDDDLEKEDAY